MNLELAGGSGLSDGSANFNSVFSGAMATWNESLSKVRFAGVNAAARRGGDGDSSNQVFLTELRWHFLNGALAISTRWTLNNTQRVEADVAFNTATTFDSYRGSQRAGVWDLRRVALHELGHVLGLIILTRTARYVQGADEHGDRQPRYSLVADDIAGAQSLYGGGVTGTLTFPLRNEPNDFFNQLLAVYQNELRAAPSATYGDSEGAVIWLTQDARQRVGRCDHATATENTLAQITNNAGTLVCAATPAGAIPFPLATRDCCSLTSLDGDVSVSRR